jgi:uncharacterized membrane protein YkvA (DUF1232 family)
MINGYTSKKYKTATGIPQSLPLFFVLYLFYNADLMESCNTDAITAIGYIDDVAIMATGNITKESCDKLATALTTANQWAQKHASIFAPEKFQLIYFTRSKTIDTNQVLSIAWGGITPKLTCKYLEITLNTRLKWKQYIQKIQRKATKSITALSCLGNSAWGLNMAFLRKIYKRVIIP